MKLRASSFQYFAPQLHAKLSYPSSLQLLPALAAMAFLLVIWIDTWRFVFFAELIKNPSPLISYILQIYG